VKVGILGGGQLARMLALAGHPLGVSCLVVDPANDACAAPVSTHIESPYDDRAALKRLVDETTVVTYEFENVADQSLATLAASVAVRPPRSALVTARDRVLEKQLFAKLGIPTAAYAPVASQADLRSALETVGLPALLKTRTEGYDGKGQVLVTDPGAAAQAWADLGQRPVIVERRVSFEREVSMIAVRDGQGQCRFYPVTENTHRDGILRLSIARPHDAMAELARDYAHRLLTVLDYIGVLALELFVTDGALLANEFAPRVHNSGHWTIEGAVTSQFENHLRAVTGLPLGSTAATGHTAMLNLIGATPDPAAVLAHANTHLHLYGKAPRPGRKVGHITVHTDDESALHATLAALGTLPGVAPAV
jgi:5-(carboxyamino)imidazole ribonucleotide synthase